MRRLLITGVSGLLGSHLMRLAEGRFETLGLRGACRVRQPGMIRAIDLTDSGRLEKAVREFRPDMVIHAAAMTAPGECEKRPEDATRVNVDATRHLASLAAELGARFVFVSTDLVFDGKKGMYREEDAVGPLSHYARTKVQAEEDTAGIAANHLIVRTSLMVGHSPRGDRSFNEAMQRAFDRGETLRLFCDEYRSLIGAGNLAEAILELAERVETGLFHVAGPERRTRHEWGMVMARHFGWDPAKIQTAKQADVKPVPPRPADVSLDIGKARRILRTRIQPIEEVLSGL